MKLYSRKFKRNKNDEFLPTITNIFKIARIFGISKCGFNLAFAWTLIIFSTLTWIEVLAFWRFVKALDGWSSDTAESRGFTARFSGSVFYGNAMISLILSCKFVYSWNGLSKHWRRVETEGSLRFPPDRWIRCKVTMVSTFVGVCALMEHILSMMASVGLNFPPSDFLERYILDSHGFLIRKDEYRLWFAIPIFILSKVATMLWNFQDLMIILISMGLSSRYNRLNTYVEHIVKIERKLANTQKRSRTGVTAIESYGDLWTQKGSGVTTYVTGSDLHVHNEIWRRIREAYVRQADMVRTVDRQLGALVLLSNINNLYFICLQLFLGLNASSRGSLIQTIYYFISLGWMMLRACSVVLAASDVHLYSKKCLVHLYSCPKSGYNVEAKRLKHQLTHDYVALSGMGLFSLKRQILLQVAAAVLKYELVLIQYDK